MTGLIRIGEWDFAPDLHLLSRGDRKIRLERKQAEVLSALAARQGQVLTRDELLAAVWGNVNVTEEVLTNAIYSLRKAFGDDSRKPGYIQTIPRRGYRLVAAVSGTEPESGAPAATRPKRTALAAASIIGVIAAVSGLLYGSFQTVSRSQVAAMIGEADAELDRGTPESAHRALELYERAIEAEPANAAALAGKALVVAELAGPAGVSRQANHTRAEREALRALQIDPEIADAHVALGSIRLAQWKWSAAEGHLRRAIALEPRSARSHAALAEYLLLAGRSEEARDSAGTATRLAPGSARVRLSAGFVHTMLRDDAAALADYRQVLSQNPGHEPARRQIEKLAVRGREEGADTPEDLLRSIDSLLRKGEVRPAIVAGMFAEAGETDRALEWLERARDQKDLSILLVRLDDRWQKLHAEPRLQAILASVGPR